MDGEGFYSMTILSHDPYSCSPSGLRPSFFLFSVAIPRHQPLSPPSSFMPPPPPRMRAACTRAPVVHGHHTLLHPLTCTHPLACLSSFVSTYVSCCLVSLSPSPLPRSLSWFTAVPSCLHTSLYVFATYHPAPCSAVLLVYSHRYTPFLFSLRCRGCNRLYWHRYSVLRLEMYDNLYYYNYCVQLRVFHQRDNSKMLR